MLSTYKIACGNILVEDFYHNFVTNVIEGHFKCPIPLRGLSPTLNNMGLESLVSSLKRDVRVHLCESIGVSCKHSFDYHNAKTARSVYNIVF